MDMDESRLFEEILTLTLKIIYLLSGEECVVVKKITGELLTTSCVRKKAGWNSIMEFSPLSQITEKNNDEKILDLTNKIIELLTGEVPMRCQDVTVHFSMEEWEYIEGHKDLYKDIMMENYQTPTSQDGSSKRNPPERCPSPSYSQACAEEDCSTTQDDQDEQLTNIKVEVIPEENETYQTDHHLLEVSTDSFTSRITSEENLFSSPNCETQNILPQDCPLEKPCTSEFFSVPHLIEQSSDSYIHKEAFLNPLSLNKDLIFTCYKCGECFSKNDPFLDHQQIHSEEKPYAYSECRKCSSVKATFLNHQEIHRGNDAFKCSECGRCFPHKSQLIRHYRSHTGEKAFPCLECGKCFTQRSHLLNHQRLHTGKNIFPCTDCGKPFTLRSQLENHRRIHTGEKPFSCSVCGKCFGQKSVLVNHQRSHTGEKPFSCPECGKCFTRKSSLFEHQGIHKQERPFPCSVCGKCFNHRSTLINHQRIHTGNKPFVCSECGKSFTRKSGLSKHQAIHTGEKPFTCSDCGK